MTKLTTILLLFGFLGCEAQEPDTIICYSTDYVDSMQLVIDGLAIVNESLQSEYIRIADTIKFQVFGLNDSTITTINKTNENISITIKNGGKRITSTFVNGERSIWFMNDTDTSSYSIGHYKIDSNDLPIVISYK